MSKKHYRLEGVIEWKHDEKYISSAIGLDGNVMSKILQLILDMTKETTKVSRILQLILEDNELTLAEKVLAIFVLGKIYEDLALMFSLKQEDNDTTII